MADARSSSPRRLSVQVRAEDGCSTVGEVLRKRMHLSTGEIRHAKYIDDGICLDGVRVHTNIPVAAGQTVSAIVGDTSEDVAQSRVLPSTGPLAIVYEDDDIIVVDKPAGIPVHPGHGHRTDTLANMVMAHLSSEGIESLCHPVHRIDVGTTGLVVFAINGHAQSRLQKAMHTPGFERTYLAICSNVPPCDEGTIDAPIGLAEGGRIKRAVRPDGKPSTTHYTVLAKAEHDEAALLSLQLATGRTHQIRVHCASIGCPLIGDALYGTADSRIGRPALHAAHISLCHPVTGERLSLDSPLPNDMRSLAEAIFPDDAFGMESYGIIDGTRHLALHAHDES